MNRLFVMLKDIMIREVSAYRKMLSLSRDKKDVLLKNSIADLDVIVKNEREVMKKIKQLELERENILNRISIEYKMSQNTLNLQAIIDLAEPKLSEEFVRLKMELESVLNELSDANALNKTLIDTHLKYLSFSLEVLTGHLNSIKTYTYSGGVSGEKEDVNLLIDKKV